MKTFAEIKNFLSILTKDFIPLGEYRHSISLNHEGKLVVTVPNKDGVFSFTLNEEDLQKTIEDLSQEILASIQHHLASKQQYFSS